MKNKIKNPINKILLLRLNIVLIQFIVFKNVWKIIQKWCDGGQIQGGFFEWPVIDLSGEKKKARKGF